MLLFWIQGNAVVWCWIQNKTKQKGKKERKKRGISKEEGWQKIKKKMRCSMKRQRQQMKRRSESQSSIFFPKTPQNSTHLHVPAFTVPFQLTNAAIILDLLYIYLCFLFLFFLMKIYYSKITTYPTVSPSSCFVFLILVFNSLL